MKKSFQENTAKNALKVANLLKIVGLNDRFYVYLMQKPKIWMFQLMSLNENTFEKEKGFIETTKW